MTPDGRITSEFDDVTLDEAADGRRTASGDDEWDDVWGDGDGIAEEWDEREEDEPAEGEDRDEDDLADLELVVLGLSGTVVLDDALVEHAFQRAADAAGIAPAPAERAEALAAVRQTVGRPAIGVFRALTGDEDHAQHANAVFESAYADGARDGGLRAVPGAEQVIRRLRASGVGVALTTGFSRPALDAVLTALGGRAFADVTLTAKEAGRGIPFPDLPLTALLRTGATSVEGMVVVGGSPSELVAGIAAGAGLVVGVLTGAHDEQALLDAGADAVIPSIADLADLLGYDHAAVL
jgi:phosphonatase-like hydrolase